MEGALVLLVAYVGLPVALAWAVVRADLRTIAKAYAIWIVFLVLTLGVNGTSRFSDGIGWAFIVAIFYTTPVIPVLCLILKLWAWLQNGLHGRRAAPL